MHNAKIALIRHGAYRQKADTPSALQPFPLTRVGEQEVRRQARAFAAVLNQHQWTISPQVHSSPLLRAWQTAQIYIQELEAYFTAPAVHIQSVALTERAVGSVANLTIAEIEQIIANDPRYPPPPPNWKADSHYCLPFLGAESLMQAGQRVAQYLQQYAHSTTECATGSQVSLFVGHGAAFRHAACHLNVIKVCEVKRLSMFHAHPVVLAQQGLDWQHIAGQWKHRQAGSEVKD